MNDIKTKGAKIMLDKERTVIFDLNSLVEIEDKFDAGIDDVMEKLENKDSKKMATLRFLLWVGLIHEDESLTEKQVGSLITMENMGEIFGALVGAFTSSMPSKQQKDELETFPMPVQE
jgi:hypothetical protein